MLWELSHPQLQIWDNQVYHDYIGAPALTQAKPPTVLPFIAPVSPLKKIIRVTQANNMLCYCASIFDCTDHMKLCYVSPRPCCENCRYSVSSSFVLAENTVGKERSLMLITFSQISHTLMHLHQGIFPLPCSFCFYSKLWLSAWDSELLNVAMRVYMHMLKKR